MDSFLPVFLIIIIVLSMYRNDTLRLTKIRKRRRNNVKMDNTLLTKYIGKLCIVQANGYISGLQGTVKEVAGNWITVEDKKGKCTTFNCDYISSIKEK